MISVYNMVPKIVRPCAPSASQIPNLIGLYAGSDGTVTAKNIKGEDVSIVMKAGGVFIGKLSVVSAFSGTNGTLLMYQEA